MKRIIVPLLLGLMLALGSACSPDDNDPVEDAGPDGGDTGPDGNDADGDCISDVDEGRIEDRDTDGDGTPDYLDDDSDNDGHLDIDEALNDCVRDPEDSDGDGIPNYIDLDSDDNRIPDSEEDGERDDDDDGLPNVADRDDDGDGITDDDELGPDPSDPPDSDSDGTPDYHDIDSDNDTIADTHERGGDTDEDGLPDYQDTDSDNDGIPDSDEAGDSDLSTFPVDTDEDSTPDFRDLDSDNDGLTDAFEWEHRDDIGSDPRNPDTDDDGIIDWIEVAAGTDPTSGMDSPITRGHFVFIVPFEDTPDPPEDTLAFSTSLQLGDVFFALDLTGSMDVELESITDNMETIIDEVTCGPGESPEMHNCIPDLWVGFGWYTDAGSTGDGYAALEVNANLTNDIDYVLSQMPTSTLSGYAESQRKAAYCTVHGPGGPYCPEAVTRNLDVWPCPGPGIGFPCYRPDAARMLILITDEPMDEDSEPDFDTVAAELLSAQITFIGVNASTDSAIDVTNDLLEIALRTGSFDEYGAPLIFYGADDDLAAAVSDAIRAASRVPLDVTARPTGSIQNGINPVDFIEHLEVNLSGDAPCTAWEDVEDTNDDGLIDTFIQIEPGTPVCWDIQVRENDFQPATDEPQIYTATIEVRGGEGGTLLDSRDVYFLIPPETYVPPIE